MAMTDDNSAGTARLASSPSANTNQATSNRLRDRLPFMNYLSNKQGPGSPDAHPKALPGDHEKADGAVDELAPAVRTQTDVPDEVKAVVAEVDDPDTPCETVRAYFLGVVFAAVGTALNTWFGSRQPGESSCALHSYQTYSQVSTSPRSLPNSCHTHSAWPWRISSPADTSPSLASASR